MAKQRKDDSDLNVSLVTSGAPPLGGDYSSVLAESLTDPEADLLRRDLAAKETEIEKLRAELASRDAASQPLSEDGGPGTYEIVVRHSPVRLKKFKCEASSEKDAWEQWCRAAMKQAWNPKDSHQREVKAFEVYLADGRATGFDRTIRRISAA